MPAGRDPRTAPLRSRWPGPHPAPRPRPNTIVAREEVDRANPRGRHFLRKPVSFFTKGQAPRRAPGPSFSAPSPPENTSGRVSCAPRWERDAPPERSSSGIRGSPPRQPPRIWRARGGSTRRGPSLRLSSARFPPGFRSGGRSSLSSSGKLLRTVGRENSRRGPGIPTRSEAPGGWW
jgi:hypothetical protein